MQKQWLTSTILNGSESLPFNNLNKFLSTIPSIISLQHTELVQVLGATKVKIFILLSPTKNRPPLALSYPQRHQTWHISRIRGTWYIVNLSISTRECPVPILITVKRLREKAQSSYSWFFFPGSLQIFQN